MPDALLVVVIIFSFAFCTGCIIIEDAKKTALVFLLIGLASVCWITYYTFQPYRVKETYVKQINIIDGVQMIIYPGKNGELELVNLNKKFGRVLKEHERIRVKVLDPGYYVGIFPAKENIEDIVEVIQPGEALAPIN